MSNRMDPMGVRHLLILCLIPTRMSPHKS